MLLPALTTLALLTVAEPFTLKTGDRVVFLGGGFIEQERLHGYFEARLTSRFPNADVRFRNLGWGGDTVKGTARTSGYQNPDGFARLLKEVQEEKPTVLILGYGMNESFDGERGLDSFTADYAKLLDKLEPLGAKIIMVAPNSHEDLGRPFPDPATHNRDLARYAKAVVDLAEKRKHRAVHLFIWFHDSKGYTINGTQLNGRGYYLASRAFEITVEIPAVTRWVVGFDKVLKLNDVEISPVPGDEVLAMAAGLKPGRYRLQIDGREAATATAAQFEDGVPLRSPLLFERWERLRQAIVAKNETWYRRWRPFNDHSRHWNYLKGDYALYDKEIVEAELNIAKLRRPTTQQWEIIRVGDEK